MRFLGWEKRVANPEMLCRREIIEVYYFENPEIRKYKGGEVIALGRKKTTNYKYLKIIDGDLKIREDNKNLFSKGFFKNCLLELNGEICIDGLSKRIGIEKKHLEYLLSDEE